MSCTVLSLCVRLSVCLFVCHIFRLHCHVIKSSVKPFGLLRGFDHVTTKFIFRWFFYHCCLLLIFTFEKGKPLRIIKINVFWMFSIMYAISSYGNHCEAMKKFTQNWTFLIHVFHMFIQKYIFADLNITHFL